MNAHCLPETDEPLSGEFLAAIYPTQKALAYRVTYPKRPKGWNGASYERTKLGFVLVAPGAHADQCEAETRRAFPNANSFRVFDVTGECWFSGNF